MKRIDSDLVKEATGVTVEMTNFDAIGLVDSEISGRVLAFLEHPRYALKLKRSRSIKGVFVRAEHADAVPEGIEPIVVDDPKWFFFSLVDYLAKTKVRSKTVISGKTQIHPSASIAENGVRIEDDVVIEPGVVVMPDVRICKGATLRAGCVLGVDGFEHKRTSRGILSVAHDGSLLVGENVEIGVNTFVPKGFSYRIAIIGDDTKIDALVHYGHAVQCGRRCFIAANAMIGGNLTLGDDVWIGPSASIANRLTIGDGAFVTFGSVVTRNVPAGGKVTGNFAIPHDVFLKNLKKSLSGD